MSVIEWLIAAGILVLFVVAKYALSALNEIRKELTMIRNILEGRKQ